MNKITSSEQTSRQPRHFLGIVAVAQLGAIDPLKAQSNKLESTGSPPRAPAVVGHNSDVDIGHRVKDDTECNTGASAIYRVDPSAQVIRTFNTVNGRLDLMRFVKYDLAELEFLTPCHLVILLSDGLSKGCEWSDGRHTRRSSFMAPNTVVFNPAQNYLRIRTTIPQDHCRMLMLAIQPGLMGWCEDVEPDLTAVQFRQQIGLDDEQACQTLVAMQRELETPGIRGAFYLDALLRLLLTRLMRSASNLAELGKPTYAKGGLANWRLKRVIELLDADPAKIPSVAKLAQLIQLHPTSFCRGFKQSTGLSPHHYILLHRVNRAKEMMTEHRLSLTEIALECGFSGSSQFSVVFRRIVGMSPRDFRRTL
jgi:AraC-like DNA-binding protein